MLKKPKRGYLKNSDHYQAKTAGASHHCQQIGPVGDIMEDKLERIMIDRTAPRNATAAAITCRPFTINGTIHSSDGVMRNISDGGFLIEIAEKYNAGTILIVRMASWPHVPISMAEDVFPRSICLAEVRWYRQQTNGDVVRYGIGLKYLG